jgi:hypothetical protein
MEGLLVVAVSLGRDAVCCSLVQSQHRAGDACFFINPSASSLFRLDPASGHWSMSVM